MIVGIGQAAQLVNTNLGRKLYFKQIELIYTETNMKSLKILILMLSCFFTNISQMIHNL